MADKTELTSAFADGELDSHETDPLLKTLYADEALRERWQRYHLIGDALRKNLPPTIHSDLAQRVQAGIENEPTILSPHPSTTTDKTATAPKRKVGLAVAASVAMVGVVSFFTMGEQAKQQPGLEVASIQQPAPVVASAPAMATTPHVVLTSDSSQPLVVDRLQPNSPKLQAYILDHEYSASSAMRRGLPPSVRVVTFSNGNDQQ